MTKKNNVKNAGETDIRHRVDRERGNLAICIVVIVMFSVLSPVLTWLLQKLFIPSTIYKTGENQAHTAAITSTAMPRFIIDPGHGGEDGGCVGTDGTLEKDINLVISLMLADILRLSGCDVIMTRTEDVLLYDRSGDYHGQKKIQDLAARLECAREYPDAFFVSIHMNSYPSQKECGLQVWYSGNDPRSETLATEIQSAARELLMPQNTRKTKLAGSGIYLLNRAVTPAVLVECGFLSNRDECALLCDAEYQKKLALTIAAACIAGADNKAID